VDGHDLPRQVSTLSTVLRAKARRSSSVEKGRLVHVTLVVGNQIDNRPVG